MAKVLVVGGAGYVGGSASAWLLDRGHQVSVLDDLSTGHREGVLVPGFTLARAGDTGPVRELLARGRFDCVMHFAASALVGESMSRREEYFENNVRQTQALIESMLAEGVRRIIFSSTCAIFGDPGGRDLDEDHPKNPINPYGETKVEAEKLLADFAARRGLQAAALRYFNAAGAEPGLRTGEWHDPETHLIPNVLKAAAADRPVQLFGGDYETPDGTCVRDYIHVTDLAAAHEAAMQRLLAGPAGAGRFEAYNLGSERGFSVRQVIEAAERVLGRKIAVDLQPRRPGDPPRLVADSRRAREALAFATARSLDEIISSAWEWEKKRRRPRRAVFLDRDGTLNADPGYLSHPDQMRLLPGVGEALAELKRAGFALVVVSNQSGVGRGLIEPAMIPAIHRRLDELLRPWGIRIERYELCFHRPEQGCDCRKPKPKLLLDAAAALEVDITKSFMVGDKASDIGAGRAAGCQASVLIRTGDGPTAEIELNREGVEPDFKGDSLPSVARWILDQTRDPGT
jgi:UDP-glucose 4-epimerase